MSGGDQRERLNDILKSLVGLGTNLKQVLAEKKDELCILLKEYPELRTYIDTSRGGTPVHVLCYRNVHPAIIELLVGLFPESVNETDNNGNTPLNAMCIHKDVSCQAIETLTRDYPESVRIPNSDGWTPLHSASFAGASLQAVQLLINKYPTALSTQDESGDTPLNMACLLGSNDSTEDDEFAAVNFEVVKLLLDSLPESLTIGDSNGNTPLHIAFRNDEASQKVVRLLVDRGGAKALKMLDNEGFPPLHVACQNGYSKEMIKLMIERYPKALRIVESFGGTALHKACFYDAPAEILPIMIDRGPTACLVLATDDESDEEDLPYDCAVTKERDATIVEMLLSATKDAVCAMLECALSPRIAILADVTDHVRETIARAIPNFNEEDLAESVHERLDPNLIKTLVSNTKLQELLKKDETYHVVIESLVRMNKSGRSRALRDPSITVAGLSVLDSMSDKVDYMFLHLRENPSLCNRHLGRGRKRKAPG
jgi:ankyrin repeat protein